MNSEAEANSLYERIMAESPDKATGLIAAADQSTIAAFQRLLEEVRSETVCIVFDLTNQNIEARIGA